METQESYKHTLLVTKELFYNESNMWGVYSFRFEDQEDEIGSGVKVHPTYNTFIISGNTPQLKRGQTYTIAFEDTYTEKYGDGYGFIEVYNDGFKSRDAQIEFLEAVLPRSIAEGIEEAFPDEDNLLEGFVEGRLSLMEVKGVGEKNHSRYMHAIALHEKYQEAIQLLSPLGVSVKVVKKLADHFGGAIALKQIIDEDIYRLTEVSGFGFKRVDEYALKLGYAVDSKARLVAGARYVLEQMSGRGDIKNPIEDFDRDMCKILEVSEVNDEVFNKILNSDYFYCKDGYISLKRLRDEELYISEKLVELLEGREEIEGIKETTERIIQENEEKQGFKFNKEQREAIELMTQEGVLILNGKAGTGKTSSVKTIVDIFRAHDISPVAMALSGKAANVLIQNGITNAGTIHRKLGWQPDGGFGFDENNPLGNRLVILDEASMVNNSLFVNILKAIKKGARLLIVGDNGQLPAIGHGAVFETLLKSSLPKVELTQVHRQAKKSGILTVANEVREHQQINGYGTEGRQIFGELKDMWVFNYLDKTLIYDDIMATVKKFRDNPDKDNKDIQVLTAMKKGKIGVPTLNAGIQDILNPHPEHGEKPHITVKGKEFRLGDRVIQNGNFYEACSFDNLKDYKKFKGDLEDTSIETSVFNGSIGYIVDFNTNADGVVEGVLVEFDTYAGKELIYYRNEEQTQDVGMLDLAYAITCHRSQGSGFKTVLFAFDYSAFMLLSKEFVYTGLTRAIETCLLFVENTALHQAIKQTHSGNRKTYLLEFIEENLNKTN